MMNIDALVSSGIMRPGDLIEINDGYETGLMIFIAKVFDTRYLPDNANGVTFIFLDHRCQKRRFGGWYYGRVISHIRDALG